MIRNRFSLVFVLVLAAQVAYITTDFALNKKNLYYDETVAYGLAASSKGAYACTVDGVQGAIPMNEWVPMSELTDYITVDKSEVFDYKSVYDNCAAEKQPPLYFFVLHFIMSLFPGVWSMWFGFAINITMLMLSQIFLFRTLELITNDKTFAVMGMGFYGFTMSAVHSCINLGSYGSGAALVMMFVYYSARLFYEKTAELKKRVKLAAPIFISVLLSALTVHDSLFVVGVFTVCYMLYYLFSRRFADMALLMIAVFAGAGLSFVLFPAAADHFAAIAADWNLGPEDGRYPSDWQNVILWSYLQRDIVGFRNSVWPTLTRMYIVIGIGALIFISVPVCFLSRKEKWYTKAKAAFITGIKTIWNKRKCFPFPALFSFAALAVCLYAEAHIVSVVADGAFVRTHLFALSGLYLIFMSALFYYPIKWILKKEVLLHKVMLRVFGIVFLAVLCFKIEDMYLEYDVNGTEIAVTERSSDMIAVVGSPDYAADISYRLYGHTGSFFIVDIQNYDGPESYGNRSAPADITYIVVENGELMADNLYINDLEKPSVEKNSLEERNVTMREVTEFYSSLLNARPVQTGFDRLSSHKVTLFKYGEQ